MNALYGGLGTGKGCELFYGSKTRYSFYYSGIFPDSAPLASAITARGRSLIVLVKKTLEERFWLTPDGVLGGFDGEPIADGGRPLRVLYGGPFPAPRGALTRRRHGQCHV